MSRNQTGSGSVQITFASPHGWVNIAEQAAELRKSGFRVVLATNQASGRTARLLAKLDKLIFHEVWPILDGQGEGIHGPDESLDRMLAAPTEDIRCNDYLGQALARRRAATETQMIAGPAPAQWYDKRWMADRLLEIGIPGPKVWDTPQTDSFPVVVKTRVTTAGFGVRVCHNQEALEAAWEELDTPPGTAFMQEFIGGQAYSTSGVADRGRLIAQETYRLIKHPTDPTGPSVQQEMVDRPDLDEHVRRFIADVGHSGIFSLQQVEDDEGVGRIYDFNPRCPGSWVALTLAGSGIKQAYLRLMRGEQSEVMPSLPTGTISTTLRLGFKGAWSDWSQVADWWRYTGTQIAQRRRAFGWRFGVWAQVHRARTLRSGLSQMARNRS